MFTLSFEGYAIDYILDYCNKNKHEAIDNVYFLNQINFEEDNLSIVHCSDDDCYQPFYEYHKNNFDNDQIILVGRSTRTKNIKGTGIRRKRSRQIR